MEENTNSKRKTAPSVPANYISILQLQERWNIEENRKPKEEEDEDENSDSKRKTASSIPANYISILQLQERWNIEKNRKQKEEEDEEERRREQKVEEQRKIEDDLKKSEVKGAGGKLIEGKNWRTNSKEKKSVDGGEARCAEKEEPAAIGSEKGKDAAPRDEGLPKKKKRIRRKRYNNNKKKKNQDVAVEEDVVVCGSIAAPLEKDVVCGSIVTEITPPVKDEIRVNRKKGKKAKGKKSVEYREKAVTDATTAIEPQFENLSIKSRETKNLKVQTRSSNRNRPNQWYDFPPRHVRMPIVDSPMVWVKKGQSERGGDGIGNGGCCGKMNKPKKD